MVVQLCSMADGTQANFLPYRMIMLSISTSQGINYYVPPRVVCTKHDYQKLGSMPSQKNNGYGICQYWGTHLHQQLIYVLHSENILLCQWFNINTGSSNILSNLQRNRLNISKTSKGFCVMLLYFAIHFFTWRFFCEGSSKSVICSL